MIESISLKKERSRGVVLATAVLMIASQGFFCQSSSAQGLLNRIRARIEARMAVPPPPGPLVPPYGYRPPAGGAADPLAPSSQRPRVLATPTPQQRFAPGEYNSPRASAAEMAEPTFGVEVVPVGFGPNRGLEIRGFSPDSPLPEAGVRRGDVIVSLDGRRTDSMATIIAARRQISPGETPSMQIVRGGQLFQVHLPTWPLDDAAANQSEPFATTDASRTDSARYANGESGMGTVSGAGGASRSAAKPPLDEPPVVNSPIEESGYQVSSPDRPPHQDSSSNPTPARPRASLGIRARDASPQRGVIVVDVKDESAGSVGGIEVNDRIVSAAGRLIRDTSGLIRELALTQPGDSVNLGIVRGDVMHELTLEMGGADGKPIQGATGVAKSADQLPSTSPEQAVSDDPSSSENNLLNGFGTALGNFFSGASSQQMDSPKNAEKSQATPEQQSTEDVPDADANVFELPAPAAEPDSKPDPEPADPLALPEDE